MAGELGYLSRMVEIEMGERERKCEWRLGWAEENGLTQTGIS